MRREMRVGRMRTEDAHRQGGDSIKNLFQQNTIFPKFGFSLLALGLSRPIRDLTHPEDPTGDRSETGRPDHSGVRRWISASRTRKRWVGQRVFSSKPEEIRPNRDLSISRRSYLHPARSQSFPAISQLDPWNLHWIWRDLTRSGEISPNLMRFRRIRRKSGENITEISPLNRLILGDFQISTSDRTDRRPLKVRSARSDQPCRSAAG